MNINRINTFIPFTAKSSFRDEELFDESIDNVDEGYRIYDSNDLSKQSKKKLVLPEEYIYTYNLVNSPKVYINTEPLVNNFSGEELYNDNVKKSNIPMKVELPKKNLERKIQEFCIDEEHETIYNKYRYKGFSTREIINITNTSKLTDENGGKKINYNMLRSGFEILDNWAKPLELKDVTKVLRMAVLKDDNECEYFSPELFEFVYDFPESYSDVLKVDENDNKVFDNISADEFKKLFSFYHDKKTASSILKSCKVSDKFGNKYPNSDLFNAAHKLMEMEHVNCLEIPDIINSLKSKIYPHLKEEYINKYKLKYLLSCESNKTGKEILELLYKN